MRKRPMANNQNQYAKTVSMFDANLKRLHKTISCSPNTLNSGAHNIHSFIHLVFHLRWTKSASMESGIVYASWWRKPECGQPRDSQHKTKGIMGGVGKYNDMVGWMPSNRSPFSKRMHGSAQEWLLYSHSVHVGFVYGSQPIPTHAPFPTLPLQGMLRHKCLRSSAWEKGLQKFIAFSQPNVDSDMDTGLDIRAHDRRPRAMRHGHEYGCMV